MQPATMPITSFLEGYSRIRSREGALLGVSKFLSWRFKKPTTTGPRNRKRINIPAVEALAVDYLTGGCESLRATSCAMPPFSLVSTRPFR